MRAQFIMLAVVQIALVGVSPTAATLQKQDIDDIQLLRIQREIAILQTKEVANCFFPHSLQDYSTKLGLMGGQSNEDVANGTEICTNRVYARAIGGIDATFDGAIVADPSITSTAIKAHPLLSNGLREMVKAICHALKLVLEKQGPTTTTAIKAIADEIVPAAVIWNQQYLDVVRTRQNFHSEIRRGLEEAEIRSTDSIVSGVNETFIGIQELASSDLEAGSEEVSSIMKTFRNKVYNKFVSSVTEKFDIAETVFLTSRLGHSGHGRCSSGRKNRIRFIKCEEQNAMKSAALQIQTGISAIFDTILRLSTVKNPNLSRSDSSKNESAKIEISRPFVEAIEVAFIGVQKINPGDLTIVETRIEAAKNRMKKIISIIDDSIESIGGEDPGIILSQLETSINKTMLEASEVVVDLFDLILTVVQSRFPEIDAESRASVQPDQEKTITQMKKLFQFIFTAIKVRIIGISSGMRTEGETIVPPLKAAQAEAFAAAKAVAKTVVDVIIRLLKAVVDSKKDSIDITAFESSRERALFQLEKGIAIIFSKLIAYNQNAPEYIASDIMEAGRVATTASYLDGLENIFCAFLANDTGIIFAAKGKALSAMQIAVDSLYDAIQESQGSNSCEMLSKLEIMNATTTGHFVNMILELFDGIRKSPNYDIQIEPALALTQNNSILNSKIASATVFNSIRSLAALNCPGSKTNSMDNLVLVTTEYNRAASVLANWSGSISEAVTSISPKKRGHVLHNRHHVTHTVTYEIHAGNNSQILAPIQTAADAEN